jgi:hypothetical protein
MIDFVEYDENIHKENLFDMYMKLGEWLNLYLIIGVVMIVAFCARAFVNNNAHL